LTIATSGHGYAFIGVPALNMKQLMLSYAQNTPAPVWYHLAPVRIRTAIEHGS